MTRSIEEIKAQQKSYRESKKESASVYFKAHYEANRDEKIAYSRANYAANKDSRSAQTKLYRAANKDLIAARKRERYLANKDCVRLKGIAYRAANKDAVAARKKAYHDAHKVELYAQKKIYCQENKVQIAAKKKATRLASPEASRAGRATRRARLKNAEGTFSKLDLKALMTSQKGLCIVCRTSIKDGYHIDHIKPLANGGSNDKLNLQLLCQPCNRSKGAKDPIDFMQQRGYLL